MSTKFCDDCFAELEKHNKNKCDDCLATKQTKKVESKISRRSRGKWEPNISSNENWESVPSPYKDYRGKE